MAKTFQDLLNEGQAKVLGIVSIVPMDDWNADTQYQKLNLVRHNGATYLAKGGNKNVEPGAAADWQNSWMLVYLDGILSPDGTYPNLTAGRVMHALAWGNKNYDGSSAQTITAADLGLADVYKPQGSIAYSALPATPSASNYGYVWNITNDFTTDSRFIEGAGKEYSAGTNVGVIEQNGAYYYDILGNFVDFSDYAKIDGNYQEMTVGQATNAQNAANVTSQINGHAISDIFETDGTTVKEATQAQRASADEDGNNIPNTYARQNGNYQEMTVGQATNAQNAANVTSQINGHAISDIFETDGTTVKEATQAQRASADEDGNNIPDTYAKQNGTYRNLIAGGVDNVGIGSTTNINDYYGADYWGKEYYFGGANNPQGSPEGISGGHLSVIRAGSSTTIQVIRTGVGSDFSGLPTTYQRDWNGSVWTDWGEIVTADGSYPTLGAGYLQHQGISSVSSSTIGWYKVGTTSASKIVEGNGSVSVIFLVNGVYQIESTATPSRSGLLELDVTKLDGNFTTFTISVLGGALDPEQFFGVLENNVVTLYWRNVSTYGKVDFTILTQQDETLGNWSDLFEFDTAFYGTSAPSGAVYAVNRNVAAKGVTPATSSNSDDVATTEWVNDKIPAVPAVPNLNGSTSYSGTYYAAKSLPGNGTFLVGTGTTSSPISGVNLNSRSGFTEADYISFGSATSGNGTLESYTAHAYLGIRWTKTNSSGEQYITAYWIPTILLVNGDADHYFCVTDSEDFVNFWFSSNTRFNYVSSKISSMRVSLYDYNT